MKLSNAIKTLEKRGFVVSHEEPRPSYLYPGTTCLPSRYCARKDGAPTVIDFTRNGGEDYVATIRVRRDNDHDDSQSDYCAGVWCDTLKRAIELASYD